MSGDRYEAQFKQVLYGRLQQVCRENNLPAPAIQLAHSDRPGERPVGMSDAAGAWEEFAAARGLAFDSRVLECDFLVTVTWPDRRPVELLGESTLTVDHGHLNKVAAQLDDLNQAQPRDGVVPETVALLIGTGFTAELGPAAIEAIGAVWLHRPANENDDAWRRVDDLAAPLRAAHARAAAPAAERETA